MKTKNLLAALLLMVSTIMMADDLNCLTISYNSSSVEDIYLPTVQRITFEERYVVVTTTDGKYSYPISALDKITFTEKTDATAIEALPEQAEDLTFKDGRLSIKGNGLLRIYNTAGALVCIANVKEGANVSLNNLPAGVYIVRMGDKTIKLRK